MKPNLLLGDCAEKMRELPANSIDSIVTDPPYALTGASGSGTTGVAAIEEGMDFIGIEKDPHYAEIAKRRIGA